MARARKWYVAVWHDGQDYEAGESPNEVQVQQALSAAHAEELVAVRHPEWEVLEASEVERCDRRGW